MASGFATLAIVGFVVFAATRADGRPASEADTNDGGAWLASVDDGGAAHVEYLTGESTTKSRVTDPGGAFDLDQAPGVVLSHSLGASSVAQIDPVESATLEQVPVPEGAVVRAIPGGIVVFDPATSSLWKLPVSELASVDEFTAETDSSGTAERVDAARPQMIGSGAGLVAVSPDGTVGVVDAVAGSFQWAGSDGPTNTIGLPEGFTPSLMSMAGNRAVLVGDGNVVLVEGSSSRRLDTSKPFDVDVVQWESLEWPIFVGVTGAGTTRQLDLETGEVTDLEGEAAANPARPLVYGGCSYRLGGETELVYRVDCAGGEHEESTLAPSPNRRLRLVNGWVWIDTFDGSGYAIDPDLNTRELADFSDSFQQDNRGDENDSSKNIEKVLNPDADDAEQTEADERDDNAQNEPPIAADDEAATRPGRPVVVDVLANDTDPDADVLLVEATTWTLLEGDASVEVSAAQNSVQINPEPLYLGPIRVQYTVTDGYPNSSDTAIITVDVRSFEEENQPPDAVRDRTSGTQGKTVSINLIDNDSDPDGDSLQLLELRDGGNVDILSTDAGGSVLLAIPTDLSAGTLELEYVVADELGLTGLGVLEIEVRLESSNQEPDARNDAGSTVVGQPLILNLLANDSDADNDPLRIGQAAFAIDPADPGGSFVTFDDGEFVFTPAQPGTYVFEYQATDRAASDAAFIRVEVTGEVPNRQPVAVRDDAVIAVGSERVIRVLENDGDPDGDVIDIVAHTLTPGLKVTKMTGIGFRVEVLGGAQPIEQFDYQISDGLSDPVTGTVVVVVSDRPVENAAPIVNDDVARIRPGRTSPVPVVLNDYDPEGGSLLVVEATGPEGVTAAPGPDKQTVEITVPADQITGFTAQYTVVDEAGQLAAGEIDVSLVPEGENTGPTARPDIVTTQVDTPVVIAVLANDTDPQGDAISLTGVLQQPSAGTVEPGEAPGTYLYTPLNVTGTIRFTYLVQDSEGETAQGEVAIGVMPLPPQNQPPEAVDDTDFEFEAGSGEVTLDVLANDVDPDGDDLVITEFSGPEGLTVATDNRALRLEIPATVPDDGVEISFRYSISDQHGNNDSASGVVTVLPSVEPKPPVANPDDFGPVRAGDTVRVPVLINDLDPDGDPADLVITSTGGQGVGGFLQLVAPAESGQIPYTVTDNQGLSASSYVSLIVEENLPPVVQSVINLGELAAGEERTVDLTQFASDPDGDTLTFNCCTGEGGGNTRSATSGNDNRRVIVRADDSYVGEGGFSFTVVDTADNFTPGRVVFTVKPPENTKPVARDRQVAVEAGTNVPFDLGSMFTDPDPDDAVLSIELGNVGSPAKVASRSGNTVTLTAAIASEAANVPVTVSATDSAGETVSAVLLIEVKPSSVEPPTATADRGNAKAGEPSTINVLANDFSPLGTPLTLVGATTPNGTVTTSGPSIVFTPDPGFFGTATVTYQVEDSRGAPLGRAEGLVSVGVIGFPDIPTGVQATADSKTAAVSWSSPANRGAPITGYEVRWENGASVSTGPSPSYTFNGLTNGQTYRFQVRAINEAGPSEWSAFSSAVTPDELPGQPGKPTTVFGDRQLAVSWSPAPNQGSAITNYQVEIGGACGSSTRNAGTSTTLTWTGTINGEMCSFRVVAVNAAGAGDPGPWSDPDKSCGAPSAPVGGSGVRGDKQVALTWGQSANLNGCAIEQYEVRAVGGGPSASPGAGTTWVMSPLVNGQTYQFEVRAKNKAPEWSPWATIPGGPFKPCGVPVTPGTPTAVFGDTQATVALASAPDANGCAITTYDVQASSGGSQTATGTNHVFTGLVNGNDYTFRYRASNEVGTSDWSPVSNSVRPRGRPFAPIIGVIELGALTPPDRWAFDLSNSAASWNGGTPVDVLASGNVLDEPNFEVRPFQCRIGGNWCLRTGPYNQGSGSRACVQQPTTATAQLALVNDVGTGPYASASVAVDGCPPARTPNVNGGNGSLSISWSGGAAWYVVDISGVGSFTTTSNSFTQNGLSNNTNYTIKLHSCNQYGCNASGNVPGITVDPRTVSISNGQPYDYQYGPCNSNDCDYLNISWSNFAPNSTVTVACYAAEEGQFYTTERQSNAAGSGSYNFCFLSHSSYSSAWASVDGVRSPTIGW